MLTNHILSVARIRASRYFEILRYLSTSLLVYVYILAAIYVLVSRLGLGPVPAYVLVYSIAYLLEFSVTLVFVFEEEFRWNKVVKYVVYVIIFLTVSTLIFKAMIVSGVYYLYATLLTAAILMPARFLVNKYWVYR